VTSTDGGGVVPPAPRWEGPEEPEPGPASLPGPPGRSGSPHRLGPLRRGVRELGLALITLGVIVLLFVAYQLYGTNITEHHNQSSLAKQFQAAIASKPNNTPAANRQPAAPPATAGTLGCASSGQASAAPLAPPGEGRVVDHLVIPKLGVSKYIVEGTNENDLRLGPGHYTGTVLPGQTGNAAIAGHRTTYGAPFFELNRMAPGDAICLTDLDNRTWVYRVSAPPEVVSPSDVAVLNPTPFAQLTLTTCNPRFSATTRLVVFSRLVGRAIPPAPPGNPSQPVSAASPSAPAASTLAGGDNLGRGTSRAWPPTILYGLLFVALWAGVRIWINRTRRWHRLAAYVIGIGICLVPLWFVFENAILLLPQSI
jgi:sortase A